MSTMYMAVTADEYELPVCVRPSALTLAKALGIHKYNVLRALRFGSRTKIASGERVKIVKVEEDDESESICV